MASRSSHESTDLNGPTFEGPLTLEMRDRNDGDDIYFAITDANNRSVLGLPATHESAGRELVRLANIGIDADSQHFLK